MTENAKGTRPTLLDLWMAHHFDLLKLATAANVSKDIIHAMITSQPVRREDAERVLVQLSTLLHKECTLETMYVPLAQALPENNSEVARLMQRIDAEYESSKQALHGLAQGTTRHDFITTKMENMYERLQELRQVVGEEAAMQAMIRWQDQEASSHAYKP